MHAFIRAGMAMILAAAFFAISSNSASPAPAAAKPFQRDVAPASRAAARPSP